MFGFFKKTSWKIDGKALAFFRQVFTALPSEFQFLSNGLEKGLYRRYAVNHIMKGQHYYISFDPKQSDKSMVKGLNFDLEHIIIRQDGQAFPLHIIVYEGLWIGFEFPKSISAFTNFQVDVSSMKKGEGLPAPDKKIAQLVQGLNSEQLDLKNLHPIKIESKTYYQIKDLDDGNYLAIDAEGRVFGLIHDPYKIELIHKSVAQFVEDVNSGRFDFGKYLDGASDFS